MSDTFEAEPHATPDPTATRRFRFCRGSAAWCGPALAARQEWCKVCCLKAWMGPSTGWLISRRVCHWPQRIVQADTFDPRIKMQLTAADYEAYRKAREAGDEEAIAAFRRKQEHKNAMTVGPRSFEQWWLSRILLNPALGRKTHALLAWSLCGQLHHRRKFVAHVPAESVLPETAAGIRRFVARHHRRPSDVASSTTTEPERFPQRKSGREIMELFVWANQNCWDASVRLTARATSKKASTHGIHLSGQRLFLQEDQHDNGLKRILGRSGRWNGHDFVDMLLSHQSCSEFIAWKIYRAFVNDVLLPAPRRRPQGGRATWQDPQRPRVQPQPGRTLPQRTFLRGGQP